MMDYATARKRYGKSYYQITAVLADAVKGGSPTPTVFVPSERVRKQVQTIAEMMGVKVKVEILTDYEKQRGRERV